MTAFEHPDHGTVWASLHREVTEREETGQALRISEDRLRTGIERAPLVLFTFDRDLRCTWFFNNHVGFGGGQSAIGKTDVELFGPETGRELPQSLETCSRQERACAQTSCSSWLEAGRPSISWWSPS